jgi:putative ABC transport system permease protein
MGLAIGATGVAFSLLETIVLNPLPYATPDRLVTIAEPQGQPSNAQTISYATAHDLLTQTHALEAVSLWGDTAVRFTVAGRLDYLRGMRVTADYFETLGVRMYLGRTFRPEDDTPAAAHVIILTYDTWMRHFGGDPSVVGRTAAAADGAYVLAGVLGPGFRPLHMSNDAETPALFVPMGYSPGQMACRTCRGLRAIGRLRPGVTPRQAEIQLTNAIHQLAAADPAEYRHDAAVAVRPLIDEVVGRFRPALWMLQCAVMLLLLLGCANVATLVLARAVARRTEMAVRAALGASRWRLIRIELTESLLLSAAAGTLGVALAFVAIRVIARTGRANLPRLAELAPDASLLAFGVAATAIAAMLSGLLPAMLSSRASAAALRAGHGATAGRSYRRIMGGLAAFELALAFVLVCSVGLLGKSYAALTHLDLGYDPSHVLTLTLLPAGYGAADQHFKYFDAVAEQMRAIPGVQDAAYASTLPLSHPAPNRVYVRERPLPRDADAPSLETYQVSPNYFALMRMRITAGRGFVRGDAETAEPVAVVSEAAQRTLFDGEPAIGRHVQVTRRDEGRRWARIVGVVADVRQYGLERPPDAAVYIPLRQAYDPQGWTSLVVRSTQPSERIESEVRAAMAAVDPLQPVFHLQPMTEYVALSLSQRTLALTLIAAFGALAVALAIGGVYSVMSCGVQQRMREVGLRLALGATPRAVRWLIGRQVLAIAFAGISAGFAVDAAFSRLLRALLFGVTPLDPPTVTAAAAGIVLVALAAGWVPMRRAAGTAPMGILRGE